MKLLMFVFAALLLLQSGSSFALHDESFRAYLVSVDAKAKTLTFRYPDDATPPNWKEMVATWDDATKWERSEQEIWKREPATADLATQIKKDAKIFLSVSDRWTQDKQHWIQSLRTIPADSTIP
jgi:hypothetical protein